MIIYKIESQRDVFASSPIDLQTEAHTIVLSQAVCRPSANNYSEFKNSSVIFNGTFAIS